ncbi:hypothetical protein SAY86_031528 [Trapa natans]|uniref:non-specific serine/threonine protein kinase n=1 Tax=Trapa natans TaxID=22666 RepID=A0AAN7LRW2_TRANT|nr:hypothetical protein SAY86_031528 [Trapa natans]
MNNWSHSWAEIFFLFMQDHLALMMELLGMVPRKIALNGQYSRDYFNRYGELRHIRKLRFWPLDKVLMGKYDFTEQDAKEMSEFLVPILDFVPDKRPTAAQCLAHPWISGRPRLLQPPAVNTQVMTSDGNVHEGARDKDETEETADRVSHIEITGTPKVKK